MKTALRVIYLQENADEAVLLRRSLAAGGFDSDIALTHNEADFTAALARHDADLILADYHSHELRGPEALRIAREQSPDVPLIFLSDPVAGEGMVEAIRNGASDFIVQDTPGESGLIPAIHRALQEASERMKRKRAEVALHDAEEALSKSETRFHLAARATQDVIWDWNIERNEVLRAGLLIPFGYPEPPDERNAFEVWFQRVHPDDQQRINAGLQNLLQSRRDTWSAEYRFLRKDGSYAEIFDRGFVVRDPSGRAIRMVGAMTDVTEQRRLERARRESDERFRFMVDGVKDYAIYMLDPDGKVVNWNSGAEKMTGYATQEILGRDSAVFFPNTEVRAGKPLRVLQTAATEGQFEEEGWRVRKDRSQYWADVLTTAVRDESGQLRGFANVVRDITERKYAEEILRASEERTRLIVESAHDAFVSMDAKGVTTDWNHRAEKILGWRASEAIGRPLANFVTLPAWLGVDGSWARNSALPANTRFETEARHCDGHSFPVEVSMTLIRLREEHMFSAFLHDITERKQAEAALRRLPAEILHAQELERKRVARELHDSVGQFLTLVKIRIQSVEQMLSADPAAHAATVKARELLGNCIEEVRRIAHNLMPSELEDLGLIAALRNLCMEFSGQGIGDRAEALKIKLTYRGIPDQLSSDLKVSLFRIVQEALSNIVKHSGATHTEIDLVGTPARIHVTIKDNGKGMKTVRGGSINPGNSGMGLANMAQRAASCGGVVRVDTAPRSGTTVVVDVPLIQTDSPAVPSSAGETRQNLANAEPHETATPTPTKASL